MIPLKTTLLAVTLLIAFVTTAAPVFAGPGDMFGCTDSDDGGETLYDDYGDPAEYKHTTTECREVVVNGTQVCLFQEESDEYHAVNQGKEGWDDHTHETTDSLACTPDKIDMM